MLRPLSPLPNIEFLDPNKVYWSPLIVFLLDEDYTYAGLAQHIYRPKTNFKIMPFLV